jgi:predicted N-acetyltransferase YhbS
MNYTIKIADINDPLIDFSIRNLIKAANSSADLLPEKYLNVNLQSHASRPGFFLVAEENNEIIGCNGFLANDFLLNGINYTGYQSCWSATHPAHQGKKIFTAIITEAKKMLKEQGAGFIYGIANNRSNPIFTKKLGFTETASLVVRIPNIRIIRRYYFSGKTLDDNQHACVINEEQVKEHKVLQYPDEVKTVSFKNSWLWGKLIRKKKFGLKLPVFYVGGIYLAAEQDLQELVSGIFKSYNVLFVQFFSCKTNSFNPLLRGWKRSKMNGFIFYNLNLPAFEHFNLMVGPLDVF